MEIKIENLEAKQSKKGKPYTRLNKEYNCFEDDIISQLHKHYGKVVDLEIAEVGTFKNVRKFNGIAEDSENVVVEKVTNGAPISKGAKFDTSEDVGNSIVAQTLTKCVSNVISTTVFPADTSLEDQFKLVTQQIYRTYKKLYTQLKNNDE